MSEATRPNPEHQAVVANLEEQERLEGELSAVERELTEHGHQRNRLSEGIASAENAIGGYQQNEERYEKPLAEARTSLKDLKADRIVLDESIGTLEERKRQLADALAAIRPGCRADAVKAHHQAIAGGEARTEQIDAIIAEHESKLAEAGRIADPRAPLILRREDLLARIAQGEADKQDLEKIDAEIQAASEKHKLEISRREKIVGETGQTLAGLRRRREAAAADLEHLRALAPKVLDQFLLAETEQVAKAYARHAAKLAEALKRAAALEELRDNNGLRTTGTAVPLERGKTYVPRLADTREVGRMGYAHTQPLLVGADLAPGAEALRETLESERSRLAELGIEDL